MPLTRKIEEVERFFTGDGSVREAAPQLSRA